MRRDPDLAWRILQAVESSGIDPCEGVALDFVGEYPKNVVSEHVRLLDEAGPIEAYDFMALGPDGYRWMPKRLTMAGHDFLDAARNEENWIAGKRLLDQAGGVSFALLKGLLISLAKRKLGLAG